MLQVTDCCTGGSEVSCFATCYIRSETTEHLRVPQGPFSVDWGHFPIIGLVELWSRTSYICTLSAVSLLMFEKYLCWKYICCVPTVLPLHLKCKAPEQKPDFIVQYSSAKLKCLWCITFLSNKHPPPLVFHLIIFWQQSEYAVGRDTVLLVLLFNQ